MSQYIYNFMVELHSDCHWVPVDAVGGDDVQQLCEAGEEEFLEIMALVGMASKPLHVRRLQKALQEWVTNPGDLTKDLILVKYTCTYMLLHVA